MTHKQLMNAKRASALVEAARGANRPLPSTNYVQRKVMRGVGDIKHFVPMNDGTRRYASLNYVTGKRWNGEVMA